MRVLVPFAVCMTGCLAGDLEITSPDDGQTIRNHLPIAFRVQTHGIEPWAFAIDVDGVRSTELVEVAPALGTGCDDCSYTVSWPALDVGTGIHTITVAAVDDGGAPIATADLDLVFDDEPEIRSMRPSGTDLRGVGMATLGGTIFERGTLMIDLSIVGIGPLVHETRDDCRHGCRLAYPWDTNDLPAGAYTFKLALEDDAGHRADASHTVLLDDIVRVTAIQVTNESDFSLLDMEVHMFDSANQFVGCAGNPGLEGVDASNVHYDVNAPFITAEEMRLGGADIGDRAVRFEVWEDDAAPCPSPAGGSDDPLGATPARTLAEWKLVPQPMSFGTTTELAIEIGRPYSD